MEQNYNGTGAEAGESVRLRNSAGRVRLLGEGCFQTI